MQPLHSVRNDYQGDSQVWKTLSDTPHKAINEWLSEALKIEKEPTAFSLATATVSGQPSQRTMLAKDITPEGLIFFSNYLSQKGQDLLQNPQASALFFWPNLARQIRIYGQVEKISETDSAAYFITRPKDSQIAALTSEQSQPGDPAALLNKYADLKEYYQTHAIQKPAHWGGYRLNFDRIEFWLGKPNRLHERLVFEKSSSGNYKTFWLQP